MRLEDLEYRLAQAWLELEYLVVRPAGMTHKRHMLELHATLNGLRETKNYIEKNGVTVDDGCGKYRFVSGSEVAAL